MESMTISERRVDEMQRALIALVRHGETRLPAVQQELAEIRQTVYQAAEAIYNATLYDPESERCDHA